MEIINASIQSDLSQCALEEGLNKLESKNLFRVFLFVSSSYTFSYIFDVIDSSKIIGIPMKNIDTSDILEKDSWMLIDYMNKKIYYNEGA